MVKQITVFLYNSLFAMIYGSATRYWEGRYKQSGNSGAGSYGISAQYKADIINVFVKKKSINKIIEFGCGDGNQLALYNLPKYTGLDVSQSAIKLCRNKFNGDASKEFVLYEPGKFLTQAVFDLSISIDVIYHLINDATFQQYMDHLFSSSSAYVVIYAWDVEGEQYGHVKHRKFSDWISQKMLDWETEQIIRSGNGKGFCDFFIYRKKDEHVSRTSTGSV